MFRFANSGTGVACWSCVRVLGLLGGTRGPTRGFYRYTRPTAMPLKALPARPFCETCLLPHLLGAGAPVDDDPHQGMAVPHSRAGNCSPSTNRPTCAPPEQQTAIAHLGLVAILLHLAQHPAGGHGVEVLVQLALELAAVALLRVVRQEADLRRRAGAKASATVPYAMRAVHQECLATTYCTARFVPHQLTSPPLSPPLQLSSCSLPNYAPRLAPHRSTASPSSCLASPGYRRTPRALRPASLVHCPHSTLAPPKPTCMPLPSAPCPSLPSARTTPFSHASPPAPLLPGAHVAPCPSQRPRRNLPPSLAAARDLDTCLTLRTPLHAPCAHAAPLTHTLAEHPHGALPAPTFRRVFGSTNFRTAFHSTLNSLGASTMMNRPRRSG